MDDPTKTQPDTAGNDPVKSELHYEETPIIDPNSGEVASPAATLPHLSATPASGVTYEKEDLIPEAAQMFQPDTSPTAPSGSPKPAPKTPSTNPPRNNHIGMIIFIVLLFGLGVWLSIQLRSFFSPTTSREVAVPTSAPVPLVTPINTSASSSAAVDSSWVTYQVLSGATKKSITGVAFKLPSTVAAPVCDSANCPSQGTNLPGGTRFTVAARGKGQLLPDFRGAILTDATGKEFTMKQTTIGGIYGYEYVGNFTGQTGGGYTFTAMRGVLVPVNDNLAIEFNHFAPGGTTSDFAADDTLFDAIVGSFTTIIPTPTAVAPTIPTATSSGY